MIPEAPDGSHEPEHPEENEAHREADRDDGRGPRSCPAAQRHAAQGDAQPREDGVEDVSEPRNSWHGQEPHEQAVLGLGLGRIRREHLTRDDGR